MPSSSTLDRSRLLFAGIVGLLIAFSPPPAAAQIQSKAQQSCIVGMNRALAKVAKAQHGVVSECVDAMTEGSLPATPGSLETCLTTLDSRVAKAVEKVTKTDAKKCATLPSFGYVPAAAASAAVIGQVNAHALDLLGAAPEIPLAPGSSSALRNECQRSIAKTYTRANDARLREFIDCKKFGLKVGGIDSSDDLQNCFTALDDDGKGRIGKAFEKLARAYLKRCIDVADIGAAFPGDCAGSGDLLTCMDQASRCRTCLTLNLTDNVNEPCELYDNGEADGSCVDPAADECAGENGGNNCDVNASCTDLPTGFVCTCDAGYAGDGVNCADINECAEGTDNCDVNAICTNTEAAFECACKLGFAGDGLVCVDENECLGQGTGNNCHVDASCTNTVGGFLCDCNPGYVGTGVDCIDRNECAMFIDDCHQHAFCTNIPGSYTCTCDPGYGGDGVTCVDFNECLGEGGGNNCHANAACTNLPATFSCACNPGFAGDGLNCVDINECTLGTDNCHANATCTNTVGSFNCACDAGYTGSGVVCVDENECLGQGSGNNCSVDANCINQAGTFDCACRNGYFGNPFGSVCQPISITLTSPIHGIFSQAGSIGVTGVVVANPLSDVQLTIKAGDDPAVVVPINPVDGTFSTTVPLDPALIFNGIRAEVTQLSTGATVRDRVVVIAGASRPFGGLVEQSVGLRITDSGFDAFGPVLTSLVDLDPATLLPVGSKIIENECYLLGLVCVDVTLTGANLTGFSLDLDSRTDHIHADIQLDNLEVFVQISGGISCGLRIFAAQTIIAGNYGLQPDPSDNTIIDVNQLADPTITFLPSFSHTFTSGICDSPIIGDIIQSAIGDVESLVRDGFLGFLGDPDGAGPQDGAIAQAIEDTLSGVELTGSIGAGFGVNLTTPLFSIPEDNNGITLASGAIMSTIAPDPSAPTIPATYFFPQTYPFAQLQSQISPNGIPYDMALVLSDPAFNQVLASQVESGSLNSEITEVEFVPGTGLQTITAGIMSSFLPEFALLDPATELKMIIAPTLAPVLSGNTGAGGEIAELLISHLVIEVATVAAPETVYGVLAIDLTSAFDLVIDGQTGGLLPILAAPDPQDIEITLLDNPLGMNEATIQVLIPSLVAPLIPSLSSAFGAFPLPEFLGLQPTAVDVTRTGAMIGVFLTAVPAS